MLTAIILTVGYYNIALEFSGRTLYFMEQEFGILTGDIIQSILYYRPPQSGPVSMNNLPYGKIRLAEKDVSLKVHPNYEFALIRYFTAGESPTTYCGLKAGYWRYNIPLWRGNAVKVTYHTGYGTSVSFETSEYNQYYFQEVEGFLLPLDYVFYDVINKAFYMFNEPDKIKIYHPYKSRLKIIPHPDEKPCIEIFMDGDYRSGSLPVHVDSIKDELGRKILFEYDNQDNVTKITVPDGSSITFEYFYDETGRETLMVVTDALGRKTAYHYFLFEGLPMIKKIEKWDNTVKIYEYDLASSDPTRIKKTVILDLLTGNADTTQYEYYEITSDRRDIEIYRNGKLEKRYRCEKPLTDRSIDIFLITEEEDPLGNSVVYEWAYDIWYSNAPKVYVCNKYYYKDGIQVNHIYQRYTGIIRYEWRDPFVEKTAMGYTALIDTVWFVGNIYWDWLSDGSQLYFMFYSYQFYNGHETPLVSQIRKVCGSAEILLEQHFYDERGRETLFVDANGNKTRYSYNDEYVNGEYFYSCGGIYPTRIEDAEGNVYYKGYDPVRGWLVKETDANGNITRYYYDAIGRLTKIVGPEGKPLEIFIYNDAAREKIHRIYRKYEVAPFAKVPRGEEPVGNIEYTEIITKYDALGRKISEKISGYGEVRYTYDKKGDLVCVTDPMGRKTWYRYDNIHRLTTVYLPDETPDDTTDNMRKYKIDYEWIEYSGVGNAAGVALKKTVWDPHHNRKEYFIDPRGRINKIRTYQVGIGTPKDSVVFEYGNGIFTGPTSIKNAEGQERIQVYDDSLWYLVEMSDVDRGRIHYTYDTNGNVIEMQTARDALENRVIKYSYDGLNRLKEVKKIDDSGERVLISYHYDDYSLLALTPPAGLNNPKGRLTIVKDTTGWTAYFYDVYGRLGQRWVYLKELGDTFKFSYEYDLAGNLIKFTYPDGEVVKYSYDDGNRLKWVGNLGFPAAYARYFYHPLELLYRN